MLEGFYPREDRESAYIIDYERFFKEGYRGVIFDVDNTLVPHNAPADGQAKELFARLESLGFSTCLLSNNKEPRVKLFSEAVHTQYIFKAGKPSVRGYEAAMRKMGTSRENTLFVGDQLFTDIYGANRTGLYTVLVKPIHPKEEIQIVLKRYLERVVLYFYRRRKRKA